MRSPLLASDDDANGPPPSLSSGPAAALETEESEFSRLIAQQSPFDALEERFGAANDPNAAANYALLQDVDPNELARNVHSNRNIPLVTPPRGPLATAIAGALMVVHVCFVWASYNAETWAESRVRVSLQWQQDFLPLLNDAKETVIRSTNLMSLLQDLNRSHNYVLMLGLWSVSLLLPCAFMIVGPTFVLADHMRPILYANRCRLWNGRGALETLMRWSLLTFYVMVLISLSTSFLVMQWTDTKIEAGNKARGALAAYVWGIASAIGVAVVLRWPTTTTTSAVPPNALTSMTQNGGNMIGDSSQTEMVQPPPPHAFQHPWRPAAATPTTAAQEEEPAMTYLEETAENPRRQPQQTASTPSTPELVSEVGEVLLQDEEEVFVPQNRNLSFRCKFISFQLGLLSLFLWIPTFYFPFLRLSYGGLATHVLTKPTLRLDVYQMGGELWRQGLHFGTPIWILLVVGTVLWLTTLVLPLMATCLGVLAWMGDGRWSRKCYSWLFAVYPALGGLVYSVALIALVHALTPFSTSLLDQESSGICQKFHEVTGETCLKVTAVALPGTWFYLAQSFVLECFVLVTLRWA